MTLATLLWALCALLLLAGLFGLILYFLPTLQPPVRAILGAIFAVLAVAIVLDALGVIDTGIIRR